MKLKLARIAVMGARLTGVIALLLGVALWLGHAGPFLHAHMGFGILLVVALWTLAAIGFSTAPGLAVLALAWGLLVPGVGFLQLNLLLGEHHWLVQVVHLLIGLGALAQTERLAGTIRRQQVTAF